MIMPVLDMENAQHRDALNTALVASGINTVYSSPATGIHILEVVVLPDDGRQALSVLAVSLNSSCQIGLSGYRSVGNTMVECGSVELVHAESVSLAVDAVKAYWGEECYLCRMDVQEVAAALAAKAKKSDTYRVLVEQAHQLRPQ